jgi:SAP domain
MYSFIFDQTYINLMILIMIVFLVMFLWRKIIILEGNFFILEKRVNLIKKDIREDSISKSVEKSDIIMNEIFKDYCPANACKNFDCFPSSGGTGNNENPGDDEYTKSANNISITEDVVQYISQQIPFNIGDNMEETSDIDVITFVNQDTVVINADETDETDKTDEVDIDKMVNSIISSSEDYEAKIITEHKVYNDDNNDADNMSVTSDIIFTSDDKKIDKTLIRKYSKMPVEKLKEFCSLNNINAEGTKNQLITRIIENKK